MFVSAEQLVGWTAALGYVGLCVTIFFEMGVFFGFILPGDSLVFAAGLLATKGYFNVKILVTCLIVTAFLAYSFAYWFGHHLGRWLKSKPDSIWYQRKYLDRAHDFYQRHGGKALIIGRVLPIIRTFVPIVAGMTQMNFKRYTLYNAIGAATWALFFTLAGYFLGTWMPHLIDFVLPIAVLIIVASLVPVFLQYWRDR